MGVALASQPGPISHEAPASGGVAIGLTPGCRRSRTVQALSCGYCVLRPVLARTPDKFERLSSDFFNIRKVCAAYLLMVYFCRGAYRIAFISASSSVASSRSDPA